MRRPETPPELAYLLTVARVLRDRLRTDRPDAGVSTLETIIWVVGLAALATLVIVAIKAAVDSRIALIK